MNISSRLVLLGSFLGLALLGSSRAEATLCTSDNQTQCWATLSGPNYCQVAVGHNTIGVGIACAVPSPQPETWGGVLHCYAAAGTSGAVVSGRGGEEAQNPGPFSSTDGARRIVSLAMTPQNTNSGPGVLIFALRSDGHLFSALTPWPLMQGSNPRIFFSDTGAAVLNGIREIAWAPTVGLVATTTANLRFVRNGSAWNQLQGGLGGNAFMLGGNNDSTGPAFYATSTRLNTTLIQNFIFNFPVDTLPGLLAAGPNQAFGPFGRTRPLTVGNQYAYAAIKPGTSNLCAGLPALTPCILRSNQSEAFPRHWGPWSLFQTSDISGIAPYTMPWTIQDGFYMRGVQGEVWVISGAQHLKFWAP